MNHEVKEWVERYQLARYRDDEIVSILEIQLGLDEFQVEDLEIFLKKLK